MFYLVRNLKTNLTFIPHDMDKLHSQDSIVQMLRDKVQGLCFNEYGFVVKIAKDDTAYSESDQIDQKQQNSNIKEEQDDNQIHASKKKNKRYYLISAPQVDENGIKVSVTFSAICFKAQKNDLIQFKVAEVCEDYVQGFIGHVEVKVPRGLIEGFQYKKDENIFISRSGSQNKFIKIDKGTKVKAKCISTSIEFNVFMKIVAEINKTLVDFIENDYK